MASANTDGLPARLPKPDSCGSYYFGEKHGTNCPAIFRASANGPHKDSFIATLAGDQGFLFDGRNLRYFDTPMEALMALKERRRHLLKCANLLCAIKKA